MFVWVNINDGDFKAGHVGSSRFIINSFSDTVYTLLLQKQIYFYCIISQHIERIKMYDKAGVFITVKWCPSHKHTGFPCVMSALLSYPFSTQSVYHIQYLAVFDV